MQNIVYSHGNKRRAATLAIGTSIWMALSAIVASSGLLSRFDIAPPPMLVMIAAVFAVSFALSLSALGRTLASEISLVALVGLQSFRLPVVLVTIAISGHIIITRKLLLQRAGASH